MPLSDHDISRIAAGVIARTLPKAEWTHEGHFACALWLLSQPGRDAVAELPDLIRAYNVSTGGQNTETAGYHETITLASLRCARAALDARPEASLAAVLAELMDSRYGHSDWLAAHWSKEALFCPEARRAWADPDLLPLPF